MEQSRTPEAPFLISIVLLSLLVLALFRLTWLLLFDNGEPKSKSDVKLLMFV